MRKHPRSCKQTYNYVNTQYEEDTYQKRSKQQDFPVFIS